MTSPLEVARLLQLSADQHGVGPRHVVPEPVALDDPLALYDRLITDGELRDTTRNLFRNGHNSLAVEEAFKCVNNLVKRKSGETADGQNLMNSTFSLGAPVLKLNALKTQSQRDQQLGYMQILAGCMTGIRNPRAHEHAYLDEPHVALELLGLANHLVRLIKGSKRSRRGAGSNGK